MKILLLEDDEILNELISSFLIKKDYEVESLYDGEEAEEVLYTKNFDLLLLDVNVPTLSGFELLKNLRQNGINTPAIFITSLNDTVDLKEGFLSGCDDYIKKPFEFEELDLRIENIKRLYKIETNHIEKISQDVSYSFSDSLISKNDEKFSLSKKESKVFEYFLKNKNRIISSDELSLNVWAYEDKPSDSTIRTYIKNFRKILGEESITTIKGVGYRFN
jgi:DNA-binding response OmpR family regulator